MQYVKRTRRQDLHAPLECIRCSTVINKGDEYYAIGGCNIICEQCYENKTN